MLFEREKDKPTRTENISQFIQQTFNITISNATVRRVMKEYFMTSKKERRQKPCYIDRDLVKKLNIWFGKLYSDVIGTIPRNSIVAVDFCYFSSKPPFLRSWGRVCEKK